MEKVKSSLASKKFWATILGAIISAAAPQLGLPPEIAAKIADLVIIYLGVEGGVDGIRAWTASRKGDQP